ncbi:MAG: DUF5060 domain-containing protein [Hahellaceae bacterium]|jgi:hypothetical protein|nr:DUF5060 domain-containing protein [Hahellaceae bacterium]
MMKGLTWFQRLGLALWATTSLMTWANEPELPWLERRFSNPGYVENPFDLVADVQFTHAVSGKQFRYPLFYVGNDTWAFRFRSREAGRWHYKVESDDADLSGQHGELEVTSAQANQRGDVVAIGSQWGFQNGEVFPPQYAMVAGPQYYLSRPDRLQADVQRLLIEHGFNGFQMPVFCRWFDINQPSCSDAQGSNPDLATFDVLDEVLDAVTRQGGVVHFWMYGDNQRKENPGFLESEGGLNKVADKRLQRYILARLGPVPGWTMGYGYDLNEWSTRESLDDWFKTLSQYRDHYVHLLGARPGKHRWEQLLPQGDYASYEQHRPDYPVYVRTLKTVPGKPAFSEDRFRIREGYTLDDKDYGPDEVRRGLYRSTMAGGVANIWGYLMGEYAEANSAIVSSGDFPNREEINRWSRFFKTRFKVGMTACPGRVGAGVACLQTPERELILVYAEDSERVDLSRIDLGSYTLDAWKTPGQQDRVIQLTGQAKRKIVQLPERSDWMIVLSR